MKVKELIEELKNLPDDMEIILQKDSEGNGYSPLEGVDSDCIYVKDSDWSGNVYSTGFTAGDNCMEEEDWERLKSGPRCLVLFPVN